MLPYKSAFPLVSILLSFILFGCGGGGGGNDAPPAGTNTTNITVNPAPQNTNTASPDGPSNPSQPVTPVMPPPPPPAAAPTPDPAPTPAPAPAPITAFAASATSAPLDGATISGTVTIMVAGSAIQNIELLPSSGYLPLYARGTVSPDGTIGTIQFDTRSLPDGPLGVRVAAFNAPPGQQASSEVTAMTARTWTIRNSATPVFSASLVSSPAVGTLLPPDQPLHFAVRGSALENVELVSANDPSIIYGRFVISPDKTSASLNFYPILSPLYGSYQLRILAWNVSPGQSGQMIEVMPPTTYLIRYPRGCSFSTTPCGDPAP